MSTMLMKYFAILIILKGFPVTISTSMRLYMPCRNLYFASSSKTVLSCTSIGGGQPIFTWTLKSSNGTTSEIIESQKDHNGVKESYTSFYEKVFGSEGSITCSACLEKDCAEVTCPIHYKEQDMGLKMNLNNEKTVDSKELVCLTLQYFCETDAMAERSTDRMQLTKQTTSSADIFTLVHIPIGNSRKSMFSCSGECRDGKRKELIAHTSRAKKMEPPSIMQTNMDCSELTYSSKTTESITLQCHVTGVPTPYVYWQKDYFNVSLDDERQSDKCFFMAQNNNRELRIESLHADCSGEYRCIAVNFLAKVKGEVQKIIIDKPSSSLRKPIRRPFQRRQQFEGIRAYSAPSTTEESMIGPKSLISSASLPTYQQPILPPLSQQMLPTSSSLPPPMLPTSSTPSPLSPPMLPTSSLSPISAPLLSSPSPPSNTWVNSFAVFLMISMIACLLLLVHIYTRMQRIETELQDRDVVTGTELVNFRAGSVESLCPELTLEEQAEFLPYDARWEFPMDRLKIGNLLGEGAFGVVRKAQAVGIIEGEEETTVAVKMIKKSVELTLLRTLSNELKIMVHLGKHINVVNLLGACTETINKRELFVIVEYCRLGNLRNYLMRHKSDLKNDKKEATVVKKLENVSNLSNSDDYEDHSTPMSISDLMSWSFQVASGMEYLCSRNVLHGDLASRNVLLTETRIAKICDFGLSKQLYRFKEYKKKSDTPLPFKWMALESIKDGIFSTQSDIWSFGVVLWEIFTLAETPYTGMDTAIQYAKLVEGYRLEKPEFASQTVYDLMLKCWRTEPTCRPSFEFLVKEIGSFIEMEVKGHLEDLNDPYVDMNRQRLAVCDYLATLSAPDYVVLSSPFRNYINSTVSIDDDDHIY